jgi:hypothetical protein
MFTAFSRTTSSVETILAASWLIVPRPSCLVSLSCPSPSSFSAILKLSSGLRMLRSVLYVLYYCNVQSAFGGMDGSLRRFMIRYRQHPYLAPILLVVSLSHYQKNSSELSLALLFPAPIPLRRRRRRLHTPLPAVANANVPL